MKHYTTASLEQAKREHAARAREYNRKNDNDTVDEWVTETFEGKSLSAAALRKVFQQAGLSDLDIVNVMTGDIDSDVYDRLTAASLDPTTLETMAAVPDRWDSTELKGQLKVWPAHLGSAVASSLGVCLNYDPVRGEAWPEFVSYGTAQALGRVMKIKIST